MIQVYPVRPEKRAVIPAVTHVDGSGRLQTVSRATNPLLLALIQRFEKQTGVPVLLNTSFNENEPIVHRPRRRSTASCARTWTCWSSETSVAREDGR